MIQTMVALLLRLPQLGSQQLAFLDMLPCR
jgi:hypothetical protein